MQHGLAVTVNSVVATAAFKPVPVTQTARIDGCSREAARVVDIVKGGTPDLLDRPQCVNAYRTVASGRTCRQIDGHASGAAPIICTVFAGTSINEIIATLAAKTLVVVIGAAHQRIVEISASHLLYIGQSHGSKAPGGTTAQMGHVHCKSGTRSGQMNVNAFASGTQQCCAVCEIDGGITVANNGVVTARIQKDRVPAPSHLEIARHTAEVKAVVIRTISKVTNAIHRIGTSGLADALDGGAYA